MVDIDDADVEWLSDEFVELLEDTLSIGSFDTWVVGWGELRYWDKSLDPIEIDKKSSFVCLIRHDCDDLLGIEVRVEFLYELCLTCLLDREMDESTMSIITDDDRLDTSSWSYSTRVLSRGVHMSTCDDTSELTIEIHEDHLLVRDDSSTDYDISYLEGHDRGASCEIFSKI